MRLKRRRTLGGARSARQRTWALLAASALTLGFGLTTVPGDAGSNGQEFDYGVGCAANWTEAMGYNQNNQFEQRWVYTPAASGGANGCSQSPYYDSGWWWVGDVDIDGCWDYDGNNCYQSQGFHYCHAPQSQSSNWVYCWVAN